MRGQSRNRGARAIAVQRRRPEPTPWWVWALLTAGLLAMTPTWAQAPVVPEQVEPRQAPTTPPGSGGGQDLSTPRSQVPDSGVVTPPPVSGTPVIRPPAVGTMPVIRPPGSPGGDPTVVPK